MSTAVSPQYFTGASGCFWGTEHIFRKHYADKGLLDAKVGYIGGKDSSKNPSYEEVCTGRTGHAEAVQIKFDPAKVSYGELVEFLYRTHDPTTKDRQGNDRGTQYRSAIFPHNEEQLEEAKKVTQQIQEKVSCAARTARPAGWRPCAEFAVANLTNFSMISRTPLAALHAQRPHDCHCHRAAPEGGILPGRGVPPE